jgi:hypothetical protein
MTKIIYLNKGRAETIVDDEDYDYLKGFVWRLNTTGYATRTSHSINIARVIMKTKKGEYVDHINGDKLDNRKSNLRNVTQQQNCWNKRKKETVGVSKRDGKWRAYFWNGKKQINLGRFINKEDAMNVVDKELLKYRGEFAITNEILRQPNS